MEMAVQAWRAWQLVRLLQGVWEAMLAAGSCMMTQPLSAFWIGAPLLHNNPGFTWGAISSRTV